eukprot:Skav203569  [mRNA]  locus=scaffold3576:245246:253578:+ [translate_table: standard]
MSASLPSLPRAESLGLCKRRRVEVQSNEGCRDAVATAFFQDNVEAEVDDEAFGASGVTVPEDDNAREQAEEDEAEAGTEEQGDELGDFEIGEADPDELLALDLGEALVEEEEEEIEVTEDFLDEALDELRDELDGIDGEEDIQPPHTPEGTPEETPDSPELHQPMHRTCPCPERSSLRNGAQGGKNGARKVSFVEGKVSEGYLLDDPTGLKELIHVENFRFQDLWYSNPGAAVQCGWCQRDWPQAYGKLYGDESRSQFAQTDFVCNGCLMAAEEAFRIQQYQKESQANASAASAQAPAQARHLQMASSVAPWLNGMLLLEAAHQKGLEGNLATVAGPRWVQSEIPMGPVRCN